MEKTVKDIDTETRERTEEQGALVDFIRLSANLVAERSVFAPSEGDVDEADCTVRFMHVLDPYDPAYVFEGTLEGAELDGVLSGESFAPIPDALKRLVVEKTDAQDRWRYLTEPVTVWFAGEPRDPVADADSVISSKVSATVNDVRAVLSAWAEFWKSPEAMLGDNTRTNLVRARAILAAKYLASARTSDWAWRQEENSFVLSLGESGPDAVISPNLTVSEAGEVSISSWGYRVGGEAASSAVFPDPVSPRPWAKLDLVDMAAESALQSLAGARTLSVPDGARIADAVFDDSFDMPAISVVDGDGKVDFLPLQLIVGEGADRELFAIDAEGSVVALLPAEGTGVRYELADGERALARYREMLMVAEAPEFISREAVGERRALLRPKTGAETETVSGVPAPTRIELPCGQGTFIAVVSPETEAGPEALEVWLESFDGTSVDPVARFCDEGDENGLTVYMYDGNAEEPVEMTVDPVGCTFGNPVSECPDYVGVKE